ncbi:MAG: hypothetical protein FKY71_08145 [Spiribacter salinus]|uniref:Uncharacterized protein n=1 Tax=Spiribacter salinus TaxID=1335746 RepID=A0A540VS41_9GAMM|nr:MAG: hypothetical protein FKY71_08145 [Spiribacter salinus]
MPKANEPTPRDLEIMANATSFSVVQSKTRATFTDEQAAREHCEQQPKPTLLYAVGPVCGAEASALLGAHHPGKGWQ